MNDQYMLAAEVYQSQAQQMGHGGITTIIWLAVCAIIEAHSRPIRLAGIPGLVLDAGLCAALCYNKSAPMIDGGPGRLGEMLSGQPGAGGVGRGR